MALILNIETTSEICSVAISEDASMLCIKETTESFQHASKLTLLIQAALESGGLSLHQLDAVAISHGPGSYTGLRIGASVAKGICYALNKPLIAVNTLKALARASSSSPESDHLFLPMIDARRMEVYTSLFSSDFDEIIPPHPLILDEKSIQTYLDETKTIILTGNGAPKSIPLFHEKNFEYVETNFSAKNLILDAHHSFNHKQFEDFVYYKPLYLKPPNITKPKLHIKK